MLQLSQCGAHYLSVHAAARFYPTQKNESEYHHGNYHSKGLKGVLYAVNLLLPSEQDFRTIKRATRGEADPKISLLYQT